MALDTISVKDVLGNFAHELNRLAPLVETALQAGGFVQAIDAINAIEQQMDEIKYHFHACCFVRDKLRKEGHGRVHLL